jgi:hypothetical protein
MVNFDILVKSIITAKLMLYMAAEPEIFLSIFESQTDFPPFWEKKEME